MDTVTLSADAAEVIAASVTGPPPPCLVSAVLIGEVGRAFERLSSSMPALRRGARGGGADTRAASLAVGRAADFALLDGSCSTSFQERLT